MYMVYFSVMNMTYRHHRQPLLPANRHHVIVFTCFHQLPLIGGCVYKSLPQ